MGTRKVDRYPVDPPTVSRRESVGDVFDQPRMASQIAAGHIQACPPLKYPSDDLLVASMVWGVGMPPAMANMLRDNPTLRWEAVVLWTKIKEAAQGDKLAQEWVDTVREKMVIARRVGLVHDKPDHTIGLWER